MIARVFFFALALLLLTRSTLSVCYSNSTPPNGIQKDFGVEKLLNCGFRKCYDEPYSWATTSSELLVCNGTWFFVGAQQASSLNSISIGSFGDNSIFSTTSSTALAQPHLGTYWYFYSGYSFGFSATSQINLQPGDILSSNCDSRLSWHLDNNAGGYRAGCVTNLISSTSWRKVIYSSTIKTNSPTHAPTSSQPTGSPTQNTPKPTLQVFHLNTPAPTPYSNRSIPVVFAESSKLYGGYNVKDLSLGIGLGGGCVLLLIIIVVLFAIYRKQMNAIVKSQDRAREKKLQHKSNDSNIYYM